MKLINKRKMSFNEFVEEEELDEEDIEETIGVRKCLKINKTRLK